ncbi:MAG TPA: xylose isomerase [Armatimonadetes bacterium]|nr:xylose isomerase [Armatimonadota bacterium]
MILGLVTYQLGQAMDLPTLLETCRRTGFETVELRTTHAHGVELGLSEAAQQEVRTRFEDSGVSLWGLGTTCEYHSPDPAVVAANIEETKRWCELAAHVGARGVKVRPNGLPADVPAHQTATQIGVALAECGRAAADAGVQIYLEVHGGGGSARPAVIRDIMLACDHPSVGVCWNSNNTADEVVDGSIADRFALVAPWINSCHITELTNSYPWRELFALLQANGYEGATLAETAASSDPARVMSYYRALWQAYQPPAV